MIDNNHRYQWKRFDTKDINDNWTLKIFFEKGEKNLKLYFIQNNDNIVINPSHISNLIKQKFSPSSNFEIKSLTYKGDKWKQTDINQDDVVILGLGHLFNPEYVKGEILYLIHISYYPFEYDEEALDTFIKNVMQMKEYSKKYFGIEAQPTGRRPNGEYPEYKDAASMQSQSMTKGMYNGGFWKLLRKHCLLYTSQRLINGDDDVNYLPDLSDNYPVAYQIADDVIRCV